MDIFDLTFEATTKQLQRKQKSITRLFPTFPDRVKGIAANGGIRLKEVEPELWHFKIASGTNKGTWYDVYLKFKNIVPTIQRIVMDRRNWVGDRSRVNRKKLARKFMSVVDVEVKCSCPAFQYWGPAYILSLGKYNAKYTDDEKRPPRIRNPKQYGAFCKHIENMMKVLPFYTDTVMKWIEDFYEEAVEDTEQKAKEEYGWAKAAAKKLVKKKKEKEKNPEEDKDEEATESRVREDQESIQEERGRSGKVSKEETIYIREAHELGSCMVWVENKTKELLDKGLEDFIVVEGYVYFLGEYENRAQHTWIELSNGKKMDDTIDQFEKWGIDPEDVEYLPYGRKEYSPQEYLDLCEQFPEG